MAWVTQDRVPARIGIDEYRYAEYAGGRWFPVHKNGGWEKDWRHGDANHAGTLDLRCRRKDLPQEPVATVADYEKLDEHDCSVTTLFTHGTNEPISPFGDAMAAPTNRVAVRLIGRRSGEVRWQELDESFSVHDVIIQHDANSFFIERGES